MMTTKHTAGVALAVLALLALAHADTYMHMPPGSNNRLNERSANRNNGNRLFDSQNNNRGGYNKGDRTTEAFDTNVEQFDLSYFMSDRDHLTTGQGKSILSVEWTAQHGCGGNEHDDPHKLNCNMVLQYMCVPEDLAADMTREDCTSECFMNNPNNTDCTKAFPPCTPVDIYVKKDCTLAGFIWKDTNINDEFNCPHQCSNDNTKHSKALCEAGNGVWRTHVAAPDLWFRDGLTTDRQDYTEPNNGDLSEANRFARKDGNVRADRGLHETWEWYDECYRRERNRGLFTADQNLRNNNLGYSSAIFTRQNPNNNRRGYECPEERDYWPYWHPSPWKDIVIMTDRLDMCPFFQSESQNVKEKWFCRNTKDCNNCIRYNTRDKCIENKGSWVAVGAHNIPPPECMLSPWSRANHLGNARDGQPATYNWTLPYIHLGSKDSAFTQRCVLRLRYNISTDDYDAWRVNASFNDNEGQGIISPVTQNPNVDIGAVNTALRLAINTAQFGRTFQDRSHVFRLVPRPKDTEDRARDPNLTPTDFFGKRTLYNLNVRGKRGNIVQTFPSVEYDFVPNHLEITSEDLVHIQWTGSNTHNNGNPAGDGQAGDAGEGRGGTDRHNFVELHSRGFGESFPSTWEENTIFARMLDALDPRDSHPLSAEDAKSGWEAAKLNWALRMATVGYYNTPDEVNTKAKLNNLLDNAGASYLGGVFRFAKGSYNYMCTRNHNFSNRDQKGLLVVA